MNAAEKVFLALLQQEGVMEEVARFMHPIYKRAKAEAWEEGREAAAKDSEDSGYEPRARNIRSLPNPYKESK